MNNINKPGDAARHLITLTHDEIGPYLFIFRKTASSFSVTLDLVHPPLQLCFRKEDALPHLVPISYHADDRGKIPLAGE